MKIYNTFKAALLGCAILTMTPQIAAAQDLRVITGTSSGTLNVPMNRAVVVESDTVFEGLSVASIAIADVQALSGQSIYVLGKSPGTTTLTLTSPEGRLITTVDIRVTPDVAEFKERLRQIMPNENIEVRTANDGIVLSGTVSSVTSMERAVELAGRYAPDRVSNLLNIAGSQQVMLKVRFAEMSRSVSKSFTGSLAFEAGNLSLGTSSLIGGPDTTVSGIDSAGLLQIGGAELSIALEALESKGLVRTLAEPNLTALSGQQAKFLAGGEYPIPVAGDSDSVTIEYKPFGIELEFIPRVVGDQINLEMKAAVSALDTTVTYSVDGFSVNSFSRRETSTTVEMRDGQSFAIAGLLQDDFTDLSDQVPWLGDIPVLGALFRSASYAREQTELVIIVTPHLVSPTSGIALALPTDRVKIPTESELFLFGSTFGGSSAPRTGAAAEVAKQDFSGSYGYVME